ncbi:hypothetical protein JCM33374_g640 [Metschnikowia sp. JCM 33374]|nr:hypothetical protein JCM33374_g640 [Metschnikowia sp. JCM 33374]
MAPPALISAPRQSSISVAVRVRPFTDQEENKLVRESTSPVFCGDGGFSQPRQDEKEGKRARNFPTGLRKIVNVVDDKMLIFDPPESNPLNTMQRRAFPNGQFRGRIRDYRFVFDHLFDETATQHEVFSHTTKPLLDSVLDGYNATVFAYGATGCGKTHTISGSPENPGVIFLTMEELYKKIGLVSDTRLCDVTVSFLEIYNETIRDLLAPETPPKNLVLREDSAKRIVVSNLSTHTPNTVDDVMHLLMVGNQNRTSSPTEANAASSRSHAVLQINVTSHDRTASLSDEHTYATLSIIDLAGSERAAATKNRGARLNEGANINKSLLALGNCINALCDPRRRNHIPYRDSKLTRLLKFSLGGNCKTVMIVCISPSSQHYDETLNTLKYANRAKEIKTKVMRNQQNLDRHVGSYLKMITEQKLEIEELRAREATAIRASMDKVNTNNSACLHAILETVSSMRATLDKNHHDKWRKYFSLAKRKFLLLHLHDLHHVTTHVQNNYKDTISHSVQRFLIQAEQLQNKFNQQIINLERVYETRSEVDEILAGSVNHSLKKLMEMEGWTQTHTDIYKDMCDALQEHLQKDLLVNSSILFDFLVGRSGEFAFSVNAVCDNIDSCQDYRSGKDLNASNDHEEKLDRATSMLEKMNDSDYDMALEEATSLFINGKYDGPSRSGAHSGAEPTSASSNGLVNSRPKDKRVSTSPLRNIPATKRSMRVASSGSRAGPSPILAEESDISMDDSAIMQKSDLDEDSPISQHVNQSMLDFDSIDYQNVLDSPPMRRPSSELRGRLPGPRSTSFTFTDAKLTHSVDHGNPNKHLLLNKKASTKVLSAETDPTTRVQPAFDPVTEPDSSLMDQED